MRKLIMTLFIILSVAALAFAAPYEVSKKAGDITVGSVFDKNPPVTGKNKVTVTIKDSKQAPVDAKVAVYYSMPAMAGMPAMDYKTVADGKNGVYTATLDLGMSGPWNVEVRFILPNKELRKVAYTVDVR